jgi:tetratricopeptide (TPR) repeat protein
MDDRLRALWDFADLDASETRLREQLASESSEPGRAEVLTQLARVEGLRDRFDDGEQLIAEAERLAGLDAVARARIDLERGRLSRSSGDPAAARPLFESAFDIALGAEQYFIAADAAHMVALAASGPAEFEEWTNRGIELADQHEGASYWRGSLLNNLGWEYYDAGRYEEALDAFERALASREREPENAEPIALARYAVGKALRAVGRADEALPLLEQAVAWADGVGRPDGWYHEELAEEYAATGRPDEARTQASLALHLLREEDSAFAGSVREARLQALVGAR